MTTPQPDDIWNKLLAQSAPTFAGETEPPYGFVTGALATLRVHQHQQREIERIGWRALLASLAALGMAAIVAVSVDLRDSSDLEPGVRSLVQVGNLPYS